MSRVSTANSANPRSMSTAMQLPNIPRLTADEKSRSKYISDYEKFEPELRRHHIGTAETTNTLGLKDVPADFDRTVPSLSEPTRAEVEFARLHPGRARSAKRPAEGGAAATPPAMAVSPFEAAVAAKRATLQSNTSSPRLQPQQQQPQPPPRGSHDGRPSSARRASMEAPLPRDAKELPSFLAAVPLSERTAADVVAANAAEQDVAVAANAAPRKPGLPAASAASPPSLLKKSATAETKVAMSLPRMRSAPPLAAKVASATRNSTFTTAAHAAHASSTREKRADGTRAYSSRRAHTTAPPSLFPSSAGPAALFSATTKKDTSVEETARVLCVLLEPPPQYASSLNLDLSCFDLDWMRTGAGLPRHLTTLATYNDVSGSTQAPPVKINSPRSAVTLLEHGVSLKDWAINDDVESPSARPSSAGARLHAELQQHRRTHQQQKQRAMREALEKSYAQLCARAPLQDLLASYRQARRANVHSDAALHSRGSLHNETAEEEETAVATAVLQRQERQRRVFETNKVRMLRQVQQAQEMHARQTAADQRQQLAEAEAEAERQRKAAEEEKARQLQQERLEARRAERERREETVRAELQERLRKAELRNAERVAARERQQRALQQEREAQAAERARRLDRNTAVLEEQAAAQEQRRHEKEKKAEEARLAREVRLAEEQRLLTERQQRAAQQREEARQRAADAEEAARDAALARQAQAEARLQDFYARRREEAAQRAAAEAEHQHRLDEARAEAHAKEEKFKADIQDKLQQHEARYEDTRARQAADIAWRREAEREEQEEKAYAVLQLQRVAEFQKLHTVVDLLEKRRAADAVTRQRDRVCEQAMRDREKLREERDALKQQLAKSAP